MAKSTEAYEAEAEQSIWWAKEVICFTAGVGLALVLWAASAIVKAACNCGC